MSNFENFARQSGGLSGTDPAIFTAVTMDDLGTITAAGYMDDKSVLARGLTGSPDPVTERGVVKVNDVLFINYSESGDFPNPTSTLNVFYVTFDGTHYNLTAFPELGLGALAAANNLSDLSNTLTALGNLGALYTQTVAVTFSDLATGGTKVLQASTGSDRFAVRNIILTNDATNFSGGGGNRDMRIQSADGSLVLATVSAAKLQAITISQWGDSGLAYPTGGNLINASTPAGNDLVAKYNGGTTDYTAGSATFILILEKTA